MLPQQHERCNAGDSGPYGRSGTAVPGRHAPKDPGVKDPGVQARKNQHHDFDAEPDAVIRAYGNREEQQHARDHHHDKARHHPRQKLVSDLRYGHATK